ncbi:glycosyltransferase family 39 protein [Candidatus Gottesmanbacteria bacterium]|nr:glycosyltransferase family 39 protein [Candidatus Gottesmanbacteria bacterium]
MSKEFQKISTVFTKKKKLWLLFLLGASLLFRFYNFQSFLFFGMDQEYEAFIVKNIVSFRHFPLIGVNASDTGLYLGPAFIYFAAIPFALFDGNPVGWGITASILGVLTTYLIFHVGRSLFSERVGFIGALLYGCSFLASYYDRNFWNPTPIPLLSVLMGYILVKFSTNTYKYLLLLALVFGLGIQSHLSFVVFAPLIFLVLWSKRKHISQKAALLSIGIFLALQLSIILFDLRHNFTNTRALVHLIIQTSPGNSISTLSDRLGIFVSSLGRFLWMPASSDMFVETGQCKELSAIQRIAPPEIWTISLLSLGVFLFLFFQMRRNRRQQLFGRLEYLFCVHIYRILFITGIVLFLFTRRFYEYYLLYFFPYFALILAYLLDRIWKKKEGKVAGIVFLTIFIVQNSITLFTSYSSYSYQEKIAALSYVRAYIGDSTYSLEAVGECPRFGGYRYLSEYTIGTPVSSYMDSYFAWLYRSSLKKESPQYTVLLSLIDSRGKNEDIAKWQERKYQFLSNYTVLSRERFRSIHVFILKPKS